MSELSTQVEANQERKVKLVLKFLGVIKKEHEDIRLISHSPESPTLSENIPPEWGASDTPASPDAQKQCKPDPLNATVHQIVVKKEKKRSHSSWPSTSTTTLPQAKVCRLAFYPSHSPPIILRQAATYQAPTYQAPALAPFRPLQLQGIQEPFKPIPEQGVPPFKNPLRPLDTKEAERLKRGYTNGLAKRNTLVQKVDHLHLAYFHSPTTPDWRCMDCFQDMAEGWKYAFLHCVGLAVEFNTPRCPGCNKNPFVQLRVYKCPICSMVFTYHKEDIERGVVIKHN